MKISFDRPMRTWCAVAAALTGAASMLDGKLPSKFKDIDGSAAWPVIVALFLCSAYIVADLWFNRTHPRWHWLTRHRNYCYLVVAFCASVPLFTVGQQSSIDILTVGWYLSITVLSAWMSAIDAFHKRREAASVS